MDVHPDPNQKAEKDERFNGMDGKRGVAIRDTYEDTLDLIRQLCDFYRYRDFGTTVSWRV